MVLSYRHAYHAGNAGDVVKHSVLSLVLSSLCTKKQKPLLFIDTHAAAGRYHLRNAIPSLSSPSHPSHRRGPTEYLSGIAQLWTHRQPPPSLTPYLYAVRALNGFFPSPHIPPSPPPSSLSPQPSPPSPDDVHRWFSLPSSAPSYPSTAYSPSSLIHYPGSPSLFLHLRRPQDRMLTFELHSTEHANLSDFLASHQSTSTSPSYPFYPSDSVGEGVSPRVCKVMKGSGFECYRMLPQPERRGVVFIDPPYEVEAEYSQVVESVRRCVQRWATATYAIWYPLIQGKEELANAMKEQLQATVGTASHESSASICAVLTGIPRMLDVRFSMQSFLADQLPTSTSPSPVSPTPSVDSSDVSMTSSFPRSASSFPSPTASRMRVEKRLSLYGCGLVLINPPYLLDSLLEAETLPFLSAALTSANAPAEYSLKWLNPPL